MNWKPNKWVAAVLSLIGPPLGLFYANRLRLAGIYFSLLIGLALLQVYLLMQDYTVPLTFFLAAVAMFHAYRVAARSEPTDARGWYSRWYGLCGIAAAAIVAVILFRATIYEPFRFAAQSMYPTIPRDSLFIVQKFGYGNYEAYGIRIARMTFSEPVSRGDILAFEFPRDRSIKYVMRVIGLPGDRIEYRGKRLFLTSSPP